jgi:hypothetical protein
MFLRSLLLDAGGTPAARAANALPAAANPAYARETGSAAGRELVPYRLYAAPNNQPVARVEWGQPVMSCGRAGRKYSASARAAVVSHTNAKRSVHTAPARVDWAVEKVFPSILVWKHPSGHIIACDPWFDGMETSVCPPAAVQEAGFADGAAT